MTRSLCSNLQPQAETQRKRPGRNPHNPVQVLATDVSRQSSPASEEKPNACTDSSEDHEEANETWLLHLHRKNCSVSLLIQNKTVLLTLLCDKHFRNSVQKG